MGTNQRKRYGHKGAIAHTSLTGHFEDRFAWGSFSKQESIQRLLPWTATQGKKGKGTPKEKKDLGGVAQQREESLGQKALKGTSDWGLYALGYLIFGYRCGEQLPGI